MISQEKRLSCRLDGLTTQAREQHRLKTIADLGLLQMESVPIFEEATQTAAQSLGVPICFLGLMEPERERFKAAIGLSYLGLMNELATTRQLSRLDSFNAHVVDSQQILVIEDTLTHPAFANSYLVHQYDIRSFMAAPLICSTGCCIGALAVMDIVPHQFTHQDAQFLLLMARWSMSEYERSQGQKALTQSSPDVPALSSSAKLSIANELQVDLLSFLAQELRTPLTSILGMTSVLNREIYGPLTSKQKEYLNIIHSSGQYLQSLMNEIIELSEFKETHQGLKLSSADIEMICQQAINTLEHAAQRREQKIRLTVEPGRRIWAVDKDKVRQMLYHLIFTVIQSSTAGSIVRMHVSRRDNELNIALWVSHPWLGEGLPYIEMPSETTLVEANYNNHYHEPEDSLYAIPTEVVQEAAVQSIVNEVELSKDLDKRNLGLLLSQQLAELHKGRITIQGNAEGGFRYVVVLPRLMESADN